ncbi:MAG: GWxTD domain-containing protein, partial [Acidobacteriaceae bacterium]|nr:GWxTD domain-containing protein [Acidobacteriaceae bacterium]
DDCMCGNYEMTIDPHKKDALIHVPGTALTTYQQMGQSGNRGKDQLGDGPGSATNQGKQFDLIERMAKLEAPPQIKFKDLESFLVTSKILTGPPFLFDVRTDYVKVTNDTVLVPVTIQIHNRDITFKTEDGVATGKVNIFGRISNINHRVLQTFEDTVEVSVPSELLARSQNDAKVYWKALPLPPGLYKLEIAIKDVNNTDHVGTWKRSINVPKYDDDRLSASSLILASRMERVSSKEIGQGNFVIGDTHLTPRVPPEYNAPVTFRRDQNLSFWMQVYNLGIDDKSKHNGATVQYQVVNTVNNQTILQAEEQTDRLNPNSDQVTLERTMPLASLDPGKYKIVINVDDGISKQQITESAPFNVD